VTERNPTEESLYSNFLNASCDTLHEMNRKNVKTYIS
jgi:hypothetical protein